MNNRNRLFPYLAAGLLATAGLVMAQDQPQDQAHPWRSATGADQPAPQAPPPAFQQNQYPPQNGPFQNGPGNYNQAPYPPQNGPGNYNQAPYPPQNGQGNYNQAPYPPQGYPPQQAQNGPQGNNQAPPPPIPAHLTIKPGMFVTVRINQWLSSDKNKTGDSFSASLAQPVIVDGVVVAEAGQTVGGRVTEAQKAGRVEGTSRLGIELTDLTLADGQTLPIQSQMINRNGPTSVGRDVGAIGATTALGAIIGAGADRGRGAAIGAGAGAAAGILGVLLTRGRPTVVYPESVMTFRVQQPVEIATDRSPQAFRYVEDRDYGQQQRQGPAQRPAYGAYGPGPAPYGYASPAPYYPYGYGYPYSPYYGGGIYVGIGPRFYGGYGRFRR
jgi:hypothetical protein